MPASWIAWMRTAAAVMSLLIPAPVGQAQGPVHPLAPPDRSSPQATVRTFMAGCDAVATFGADSYISRPSRASFHRMRELAETPLECLDLRGHAPSSRQKLGFAAAMSLYEVLARIDLSAVESGPADAAPAAKPDGDRWTIPNTEVTLVRMPTGEFRFSADTVDRSGRWLEQVRQLPYRRPMPIEHVSKLPIEGAGWLIPLSWVQKMPWWLRSPVAGQAVWKWIAFSVLITLWLIVLRFVFLFCRGGSAKHPVRRAIRRLMLPVFVLAAAPVVAYLSLVQINVVAGPGAVILGVTTAITHVAGAWIIWRIAPVVAEAIIASPKIPTESVDAHLIRIFSRLAGIVGAAAVLAVGADRLGVPLYGVVAGLGVGGLALALSAQPTIENLIGGLSLFADKPMKVGDLGKYGDVLGTVEGIGIRSTRIRGADRTLTSIPNATLARSSIVNFAQRDRMLIQTTLGLRYETSPDQLRCVLTKLREMLGADARLARDPLRVRFVGFGESSLDVEVFAYVLTTDWPTFLEIREQLYLNMMDIIDQAGTSIAFPSVVEYHADDAGLSRDKATAAAAEGARQRTGQS